MQSLTMAFFQNSEAIQESMLAEQRYLNLLSEIELSQSKVKVAEGNLEKELTEATILKDFFTDDVEEEWINSLNKAFLSGATPEEGIEALNKRIKEELSALDLSELATKGESFEAYQTALYGYRDAI